ncbi:MAG: hypothetical protein US41_C0038G0005 [Parcubacteria group bacterium GW2011_GWB1_37_13]|nr:MAG: hypothetical protein US41_C0038G0005 [Parcubacteria group bacterium GW2011_GWB1_37_13]
MTDRISPNLASAHLQVSQEGAPQVEPYEMPLLYPAILIILYCLGLYWGEGYKYENGEFGFTNSNPLMIHFYFKWLKLWDVEKNSLVFRLTLNEFFRKEENNIKLFWINFLGIKKEQFSKTTFIKTSLKKASLKNILKYKGILRVKVRKGTLLRNKILGAIEHISSI